MTEPSLTLRRWADKLDDGRLDLSQSADDATSDPQQRVAVTGRHSGVQVACIYSSESDGLEFFVADPQIRFEGSAYRRGLADRLLARIGVRRGLTTSWGALNATIRIVPTTSGKVDVSEFNSAAYGHAFEMLWHQPLLYKVEFNAGSGTYAHFASLSDALTMELLETHVSRCMTLRDQRDSTEAVVVSY